MTQFEVYTTSGSPSTTETSVITTTSTSSSHSASATSTTSPNSDFQGSSINTGPIIGGVVGGIGGALLILVGIWFLFMRRRSSVAPKTLEMNEQASPVRCRGTLTELNSNVSRQEVLGSTPLQQHELPGNKPVVSTFSELS